MVDELIEDIEHNLDIDIDIAEQQTARVRTCWVVKSHTADGLVIFLLYMRMSAIVIDKGCPSLFSVSVTAHSFMWHVVVSFLRSQSSLSCVTREQAKAATDKTKDAVKGAADAVKESVEEAADYLKGDSEQSTPEGKEQEKKW